MGSVDLENSFSATGRVRSVASGFKESWDLIQMEPSISNELYSDIFQSSEAESSTSNDLRRTNDLADSWYDDECVFGSSVEFTEMDREWQRRHEQFHTIGYRDGLIAGKEAAAQDGFNVGFKSSVFIGHEWGRVKGITSAVSYLPDEVMEKLVEKEETREEFRRLLRSIQSHEEGNNGVSYGEVDQSQFETCVESYRVKLQSLLEEFPFD